MLNKIHIEAGAYFSKFFLIFSKYSPNQTLPKEQIIREVKATSGAVVVEEHSYIGGLAESISSLLSENYPIPIKKVCLNDIFPVSIRMEEKNVYEKFGISRHEIIKTVKSIINQE